MQSDQSLLQPLRIGNLTLKNRVIMASLTRNRTVGTVPDAVNAQYYSQRATAGLIITEGTLISPQGSEWPYAAGISSKAHVAGWRLVTDAVHAAGGVIFCQLWHIGRVAHPLHQGGLPCIAPSAVRADGGSFRLLAGAPSYVTPVAIDDPMDIIAQYKNAAMLAREAGFDGVEIHSANGYLPDQFLDAGSNQRTDQWGGSHQNRCRFVLAAVDAAIDVWGAERVGIKLSPGGGYNDVGMDYDSLLQTYTYLLEQLSERRIAYVQMYRHDPAEDGTHYEPAVLCKAWTGGVLLMNGGYDAESGRQAVQDGAADAIVYGTHFVANPDLPQRISTGAQLTEPDEATLYGYPGYPAEYTHRGVGYVTYEAVTE